MKLTASLIGASLIAFAAIAPAAPAFASSCNHEIVVPIKFSPGKTDWMFRGKGTHFFGSFQKGQSLAIGGAGGLNYDVGGDFSWTSEGPDPWQITIEGPGGFTQMTELDSPGLLDVDKLPATGKYVITIGPCAAWGTVGTVVVHATDPRLTIE